MRADLDQIYEWVLRRPPSIQVLLYVNAGVALGLCLVGALWGVTPVRQLAILNGVLLFATLMDHMAYRKRRTERRERLSEERSRSAKLAEALGITRSSREPLLPAWVYWGLAALSVVVGIICIILGERNAIVGWGLLIFGAPLMAFIARRGP